MQASTRLICPAPMPTVRSFWMRTIEFDFTNLLTRMPKIASRACSDEIEARVTTFHVSGRSSGNAVVWTRSPPRMRIMSVPPSR
jgi:hypothetical protein